MCLYTAVSQALESLRQEENGLKMRNCLKKQNLIRCHGRLSGIQCEQVQILVTIQGHQETAAHLKAASVSALWGSNPPPLREQQEELSPIYKDHIGKQ